MISAKTRALGLIGHPVSHSITPRIQNVALQNLGVDWINLGFRVSPADLQSAILGARALGLGGLMVTIPHKETALRFCDELHPWAQKLGAVNLLHFREDGKTEGHSSDGWGAIQSLRENGIFLQSQRVVILGGGGSARSLALSFADQKPAALMLCNRTPLRAKMIADEARALGLDAHFSGTSDEELAHALQNADLLINTTSIGMTPHSDHSPVEKRLLRPDLDVYDIVYNPLETRLLREAREIGARGVDGLGMLIYTNVYAARVCAGVDLDVEIMRREAMNALKDQGE